MATWKKVLVSGSAISQLNNDAGYLTSGTAFNAFVTASINGNNHLVADSTTDSLSFLTGSGGIILSQSIANDSITFSINNVPNSALANDGITIAGVDTSLGGSITAAAIGASGNYVSSSAQIDGASITNNTVSYGGVSVALNGSDSTPAFDLSDATNYPFSSLASVPTLVSASAFSSPSQGTVRATINGNATDVDTGLQTGDSPQFTNLTLTGNLTVEGTQINAQVANLDVEDRYILLNSGSGTIGDSGIVFGGSTGTAQSGSALVWDASYNGNDGRLAIVNAMGSNDTDNKTPNYYVAGTIVGTEANAASNQLDHPGNILVSSSGDIFIYV